jgi:sterol desaturase/sphingolipid hydroxylase (fatty acid hydroxylase superfamily)|tara:strand:- start:995 stop:1189 length:195 start_codon:yes stop_codon:yes gene_type:complete
MLPDIYLPSYVGLILSLLMIFSGQAFRINWKNKKNRWVLKAWIYGLLSSTSFFILVLIPLDLQS